MKTNQNTLLKIKLIKTKVYSNNFFFKQLQIHNFEYKLKKAFLLIYKYHTNNKKITFIFNNSINTSFLKNKKHSFLNNIAFSKKSDLIVVYSNKIINFNIFKKVYESKTPFLFFSKSNFIKNHPYQIFSNFVFFKNQKHNIFISIIEKILKNSKFK